MALEEFNHFFKSNIDEAFDIIKRNKNDMYKYCSNESNGDYNAIDINITSDDNDIKRKLHNSMRTIISSMFSVNDFNSYIKIRHDFESIFSQLYPSIQKRVFFIKQLDDNRIILSFGDREGKRKIFKQSDRLFHPSNKSGLTKLTPSFKSVRDKILYPSQRIYFCCNYPVTPDGGFWNKKGFVYEYIPNTEIILFKDEEFGKIKGMCFMTTDSPIHVKNITNEILEKYSNIEDRYKQENF